MFPKTAAIQWSLTSIDFTVKPAHVPGAPASGITRASDATPTQAGLTRISLKVFNKEGESVADTSQIAAAVGEGFNYLKIRLPAGTYTFVAVAHDTSADNIGCATIESPEVVTLPEGIIPTLYAHVQQVTIANANKQSVPIDMGKRINATLRLASTDIVPEGVSQMAVDLNPGGVKIGANNLPRFNPSTGASIEQFRFSRALPVTAGAPIDVSMNLLFLQMNTPSQRRFTHRMPQTSLSTTTLVRSRPCPSSEHTSPRPAGSTFDTSTPHR